MVETLQNVSMAAVAWAVALYTAPKWAVCRHLRSTWAFILFFALGLTFQIDAVYVVLDALAGVNNLSWLLTSTSVFLALHYCASIPYDVARAAPLQWFRFAVVAGLLSLGLVFFVGVATSAEWPCTAHDLPRTSFDLVFMGIELTYGAGMGLAISLAFTRLCRSEQATLTRLRWGLVAAAAFSGTASYVIHIVCVTVGYFYPTSAALEYLSWLALVTRWLTLVGPLAALPNANRAYQILVRLFDFVHKLIAFVKLRMAWVRLRAWLISLGLPAAEPGFPLARCLFRLDFYTCRLVVSILDIGRRLRVFAQEIVQPGNPPAFLAPDCLRDMVQVNRMLEENGGAEYAALVVACARIGEMLPRRRCRIGPTAE